MARAAPRGTERNAPPVLGMTENARHVSRLLETRFIVAMDLNCWQAGCTIIAGVVGTHPQRGFLTGVSMFQSNAKSGVDALANKKLAKL